MDRELEATVEALINATKDNQIKWGLEMIKMDPKKYPDADKVYNCAYNAKNDIRIFKYSEYVILDSEGHGYQDKVILQMLNISGDVILDITEDDLSTPHRLWTLLKMIERTVNGAKGLLDDIISKYGNKDVIF
ncbi:hypothetical protein [Lysinibacillus sp.]|uniref:hypothetical protein n=1 Tax=Lysinibacillus sp. TaxID=1869345 RepID=UPI0028A1D614|nr:hypothetical protein [Lysinibacillus sp.]